MGNDLLTKAVATVYRAKAALYKYISANDAGVTGAHQAGFYIPKSAYSIAFDQPRLKGENKDRTVRIRWQDGAAKDTESRFIYYGSGTRNEYRLTRFGRDFPFLTDEYVGALVIIAREGEDTYSGYVLNTDEEIEDALEILGIPPNATIGLIDKDRIKLEEKMRICVEECLASSNEFPDTQTMADLARKLTLLRKGASYDDRLGKWIESEYALFRCFENELCKDMLIDGFSSVDELVVAANTLLNRRKSRAGKSLEHHLAQIFTDASLHYEAQVVTEGYKKPDFIFPSGSAYHNQKFDAGDLVFLAAKTTCKDRWRQILSEADRIPVKHLFTLQKGISAKQLDEMFGQQVKLVIPEYNRDFFPTTHLPRLQTLSSFVDFVREKQKTL